MSGAMYGLWCLGTIGVICIGFVLLLTFSKWA